MNYPPYNITDKMLTYVSNIMKKIGELDYITLNKKPELRKQNRINSIHSSLAIENNQLYNINPYDIEKLKRVHGIMTFLVEEESGMFRTHGEGVYDGDRLIFMCPPAELVPSHMNDLFSWLNEAKEVVHPLI